MKTFLLATTIAMLGQIWSPAAIAGVYADDLGKCLVKSSNADDQTLLVQWMFASLSLHPAIRSLSSVTDTQRQDISRKAGALFQRLMTVDCRAESIAALKYEGSSSFESAASVLGQVAGRNMATYPKVGAEMREMGNYIDKSAFDQLAKEAGIPPDNSPTK